MSGIWKCWVSAVHVDCVAFIDGLRPWGSRHSFACKLQGNSLAKPDAFPVSRYTSPSLPLAALAATNGGPSAFFCPCESCCTLEALTSDPEHTSQCGPKSFGCGAPIDFKSFDRYTPLRLRTHVSNGARSQHGQGRRQDALPKGGPEFSQTGGGNHQRAENFIDTSLRPGEPGKNCEE